MCKIHLTPSQEKRNAHARHVDRLQAVSPYRAVLELPLSIGVPGDIILGIASTLDIVVVALPFAAFDVSIIVEQSGIKWERVNNNV